MPFCLSWKYINRSFWKPIHGIQPYKEIQGNWKCHPKSVRRKNGGFGFGTYEYCDGDDIDRTTDTAFHTKERNTKQKKYMFFWIMCFKKEFILQSS